jgi:hypothetical protein
MKCPTSGSKNSSLPTAWLKIGALKGYYHRKITEKQLAQALAPAIDHTIRDSEDLGQNKWRL